MSVMVAAYDVQVPRVSGSEWDELVVPEAYRAEVIRGELVLSPSPDLRHQRAVGELFVLTPPFPVEIRAADLL